MLDALDGIVCAVGAEIRNLAGTARVQGTWEGSQLKTEADRLAHVALCDRLAALAPELPVVSEEDAASHAAVRPRRYFLIDPIDGTASLGGGFSGYVTQIALMADDRPVLAAIHAPALGHTYTARRGAGAWRDGAALRVDPDGARRILVDNYPAPRGLAARIMAALACDGYVESGSLALKICRVADGTADLFAKDVVVRDWDIAPADLVLTEAGGRLSLPDGTPFAYTGAMDKPGVLACGPHALATAFTAWFNQGGTP